MSIDVTEEPSVIHFLSDLLFGLGPLQIRVGGDTTDVQLVKLLPNTAYTLSLFALHGESASEPLTKQGVTRM